MARKPGRKSAAEHNVIALVPSARPRITPPASLNALERAIFVQIVSTNPHLKIGDTLLIAAFAQTLAVVNKLARKTDSQSIKDWELKSRVMISLATKLRITQQAATHHGVAGRARDSAKPQSYYATMQDDDE